MYNNLSSVNCYVPIKVTGPFTVPAAMINKDIHMYRCVYNNLIIVMYQLKSPVLSLFQQLRMINKNMLNNFIMG